MATAKIMRRALDRTGLPAIVAMLLSGPSQSKAQIGQRKIDPVPAVLEDRFNASLNRINDSDDPSTIDAHVMECRKVIGYIFSSDYDHRRMRELQQTLRARLVKYRDTHPDYKIESLIY